MAQRCIKCGKGRKTKKGLCKACRGNHIKNHEEETTRP